MRKEHSYGSFIRLIFSQFHFIIYRLHLIHSSACDAVVNVKIIGGGAER